VRVTRTDRLCTELFAAVRSAANQFRVELRGESADVLSDNEDTRTILEHTFGAQANVTVIAPREKANGGLTIATFAANKYDEFLKSFADEVGKRPQALDLADYWRDDFVAKPMDVSPQRAVVHHIDPFEGFTVFERDQNLLVYVHPADAPLFIPHFEHLIAYALRLACWRNGYVDVHAAFVRYRGKGVALIGKRRAGKTSLAMHLLGHEADLLGSDMAEIRFSADGSLIAKAIPHMCRITPETVWDNALLASTIGSAYDKNKDYLSAPLFSHGKYELYGPSLDGVFGRKVCITSMKVDALLFPHFSLDTERQAIHPVPNPVGKERLLRSIENDRPLADWLPFDISCRRQTEISARKILSGDDVPLKCYDFHFGKERTLLWDEIDNAFDLM
jgi:hypothetical protein